MEQKKQNISRQVIKFLTLIFGSSLFANPLLDYQELKNIVNKKNLSSSEVNNFKSLLKLCLDANCLKLKWQLKGCFRLGKVGLMHLACENNHTEILKFLIKSNFDVNIEDKHKQTPLHWAISQGDANIVKVLIKNGADTKKSCGNGFTYMLDIAISFKNLEIVKELVKGNSPITDLHLQQVEGYYNINFHEGNFEEAYKWGNIYNLLKNSLILDINLSKYKSNDSYALDLILFDTDYIWSCLLIKIISDSDNLDKFKYIFNFKFNSSFKDRLRSLNKEDITIIEKEKVKLRHWVLKFIYQVYSNQLSGREVKDFLFQNKSALHNILNIFNSGICKDFNELKEVLSIKLYKTYINSYHKRLADSLNFYDINIICQH